MTVNNAVMQGARRCVLAFALAPIVLIIVLAFGR